MITDYKLPTSLDNSITAILFYIWTNLQVKFDESCLIEDGAYYLQNSVYFLWGL